MGAIWLAHDDRLDITCAVKFIRSDAAASSELRSRFEREAKTAAQLRTPHVVNILDYGLWRDRPYIAMEYLEGEDLAHRLKRLRVLSPRETVAIARQVGRALTRAHAAGLVHRDLKPANIFLVRDDDRDLIKVLDFGIAKVTTLATDGATKTGALLGTPYYMSPEQARGIKEIDHRADLWSLAVLTYQCLTGQLPFHSEALGDLFVKIIVETPPVPSRIAAVPPGFDAWWAKATARDASQRFQSAKEMVDVLGMALEVTSPPDLDLIEREAQKPSLALPPTAVLRPPVSGGGGSTVLLGAPQPTAGEPADDAPTIALHVEPLAPPTPVQQAISVPASPQRQAGVRRLTLLALGGATILGLASVVVALRKGAPAPVVPDRGSIMPTASAAPSSTADTADTAPAGATSATVESVTPPVTSSAATASPPSPIRSASAAPPVAPAPPPRPRPVTPPASRKTNTDFGI